MKEIWKAIEGYVGLYEVSDHGRVRTLRPANGGAEYSHPRNDAGILRAGNMNGYRIVVLHDENQKRKTHKVHVLVLEAFDMKRPRGLVAGHLNAVRSDNRLENLKWITAAENNRQRETDGHTARGESHGRAKLNIGQVREIKSLKGRVSANQLAKKYGVSCGAISFIHSGRNWSHVQ